MTFAVATDGFTQDVITLVTLSEKRGDFTLRNIVRQIPPSARADFIKSGVIGMLAPNMETMPAFVQSIVARAMLDHVDWDTVVSRITTTPENN